VTPDDVETGAVIITGETARTKNAEAILAAVSGLAGDFVVTVAGPNLESQIAGRGSGAAAYSAQEYTTAVNVDIGGGSSNAAVFRSGRHVASAAIMVGGRQLTLDPATGVVTHLAPPAAPAPGAPRAPAPPPLGREVSAGFRSAGVGRAYYDGGPAGSLAEIAAYGDLGPLLAHSLRHTPRLRARQVRGPAEPLR